MLLKDAKPVGNSIQLPIEVKLNRCDNSDLDQLRGYMEQLEPECPGGVLLAETIPRTFNVPDNVSLLRVKFEGIDLREPQSFESMEKSLSLEEVVR